MRSSLPSVLEERLPFFPEPKAFGSADGWPAEGRPAGGGAQEGIDGWRDGGKSAVSAIRRRRTLLCKSVGNGSSPNKGRQRADGRTVAREENLASQVPSNPEKGWVLKARSAKRPRSGRLGGKEPSDACVGDGGGTRAGMPGRASRAGPRSGRADSAEILLTRGCGEGEADVRPTQQRVTARSVKMITEQTRVKAGTRSGHREEERRTSGLTLQGAAL